MEGEVHQTNVTGIRRQTLKRMLMKDLSHAHLTEVFKQCCKWVLKIVIWLAFHYEDLKYSGLTSVCIIINKLCSCVCMKPGIYFAGCLYWIIRPTSTNQNCYSISIHAWICCTRGYQANPVMGMVGYRR